jgi:hypothetical protein
MAPLIDKDALLFGLDEPLSVYQTKLQAASAFLGLRKDLERNKSCLANLSIRDWRKRKNHTQLKLNAQELLQDNTGDHVLSRLLHQGDSDSTKSLNWLILALFTLTPTATEHIKKNGLSQIYADLFPNSLSDCYIFDETRDDIINILNDICGRYNTANGQVMKRISAQFVSATVARHNANCPSLTPGAVQEKTTFPRHI